MVNNTRLAIWLVLSLFLLSAGLGAQSTYYVATNGSDSTGTGSSTAPWATLGHAVRRIPDNGSTILVRPGTYSGRIRLDRRFTRKALLKSEVPYRARLVHQSTSEPVISSYGAANYELQGFELTRASASSTGDHLIHISKSSSYPAEEVVLRDNIFHDSYSNDIVKINNGARRIQVIGNVFYNQEGHDEHMDVNGVSDVEIQDNLFFNDFAGSGRTNANNTASFLVVKNSSNQPFCGRVTIARNVFLNWQGDDTSSFLRLGEDNKPFFEAEQVTIENNLFLNNTTNSIRAAFAANGVRDVTFRNNTIAGDLRGRAFAVLLYKGSLNPANENVAFYNNVWSDPSGTMQNFGDGSSLESVLVALENNLYWNNALPIPTDQDVINYFLDPRGVVGNPVLPALGTVVLPRWRGTAFASGTRTIAEEKARLVRLYGTPGSGSAALGAADVTKMPVDDILGQPRNMSRSEIGAVRVTQ